MAFRPEPWANAFVIVSGTTAAAEESLEYLRVFCRAALSLPGDLSGRNDADRLGRSIEAALARVSRDNAGGDPAVPAKRFVQLMLRKHCFFQYKRIIREIEKIICKQKGIEEVFIETAVEPEDSFLETVRARAKDMTRAKEVKLTRRLIPELIVGFRILWGSVLFDSSVKRRLQKMAGDLGALNGGGYELEA
jgi:hypothetical protein